MSDYLMPPVDEGDGQTLPVANSDDQRRRSGFAVAADGEVTNSEQSADQTPIALSWPRGTKVRIEKRAKALDPYTREVFDLAAHTKGVVVPILDKRHAPKDHVLIQINAPIDNGIGRQVLVEAIDLVKSDLPPTGH